jgi:hypothetical protein
VTVESQHVYIKVAVGSKGVPEIAEPAQGRGGWIALGRVKKNY